MSRKTGADMLDAGERFAVTMWEYSWLVQRQGLQTRPPIFGPEDEYADRDQVLDVLFEDISPNGEAGEWYWFQDIAEVGLEMTIEKGWQGICTSNFCEPHFEGMRQDIDWHQRLTKMIRG